jgi:hypothetical protein
LTWALILASARNVVTESNSVRSGGWQQTVGTDLGGKTLGVLGLGRIGSQVARIGSAFGMNLIAWSQNLTPEAAKAAGAILVSKDQPFDRRFPFGSPGSADGGALRDPALVLKEDPSFSSTSVFFTAGHLSVSQHCTFSGSRSLAFLAGRCKVQSMAPRIFHTWPG